MTGLECLVKFITCTAVLDDNCKAYNVGIAIAPEHSGMVSYLFVLFIISTGYCLFTYYLHTHLLHCIVFICFT